jgi:hypothetical protein
MENLGKRIIGFHTGRGGRFFNGGHTVCIGETNINKHINDLFIRFENEYELRKLIGKRENINNFINQNGIELFAERIKFNLGKQIYVDSNGNSVGLDVENNGTGTIDEDGIYDTTSCGFLENLSDNELQLILEYTGYIDSQIIDYCKEKLEIIA